MCEIVTALTVASTLLAAGGAAVSANADAEAKTYNSRVADMNATLADRRAKDALERGKEEEQRKRQQVATLKGRQIAAMAEGGVDLSFGSPLDTIVDTAVLGELDALTIRTNAAREAYDYRVDAASKRADAAMGRRSASAARTGGYLQAGGTLLGGGSKGYEQHKRSIGKLS